MSSFELFRKIPLFREFSHAELLKIDKMAQKVRFPPGTIIFSRGDVGDALFLIREGEVEVLTPSPEDEELEDVVSVLGPGDLFGEMALVEHEPRSATVRAKTEVKAFRLPREYFEELMREESALALKIYKRLTIILSHRLRETTERLGIANRIIRMTSRK